MLIQQLKQGQKLLVLRFGTNIVPNCKELHQQAIEENGYCWFGKIGIAPSRKCTIPVLDEENPAVILYTRNKAYLCSLEEIETDKPEKGYPDYYETELFEQLIFPKSYFKLKDIDPLALTDVSKFFVVSSGNTAMDTLNHSVSSFLYISYGKSDDVQDKLSTGQKSSVKREKRPLLPKNDCIYRKSGTCTLKSCINYQYECDRPSMCLKQKR